MPLKLDYPAFWRNATSKRKRIYTIIFIFVVAFILTVIGSLVPISSQDAHKLVDPLNQTLSQNKNNGTLPQYLFFNNFQISLVMFIPVLGLIWGLITIFVSGYAIGAISQVQGVSPLVSILGELLLPVFWLEFAAYSIAMAESIWLFRRLMQRRWGELKNTVILIGVCAALLVIGALVESWIIITFG